MLLCSISWSTAAAIPEPPSPTPSTFNDSGYSSPVHSPIPFDLSPAAEPDISSSTASQKLTSDAATTTSTPSQSSTPSQAAVSTAHAGTQSSLLSENQTKDAAVTTMSPVMISSSCQPTPTACHDVSLQATVSPPSTSKKHKKRRPTQPKPSPAPPSTTDAATSYDPPPTVVPTWCRLCYSPVLPDTPPIAHLLNCDGTPELLNAEYEGLLNDWSEAFDTSLDTLATMTELISTTFDPGSFSPSTTAFSAKDFLISKLILRSCPTSYSTFPQFCENLNALATSLETTCRNLLKIPPSEPLLAMFTYTNPDDKENPDVDDDELSEYTAYHPFDDLDNLPDPSDADDTFGYDEY